MSNTYTPDNWVIIFFDAPDDPHYRVLAGWSGGYLDSDHWRMNGGIVKSTFDGDYWYFYGHSGSVYKCYVDSYGLRNNNAYIWNQLEKSHGDKVRLLDDQEWVKDDWDWILET